MNWKQLLAQARKAFEAGDYEKAQQLTAQAKSLKAIEELEDQPADQNGDGTGDGDSTPGEGVNIITRSEHQRSLDELREQLGVTTLSEGMNTILKALEKMPGAKKAGLIAPGGGAGHQDVKSFADFCMAVYHKDHKRLQEVYKSVPVAVDKKGGWKKDISGETGTSGGYLVPPEFEQRLMEIAYDVSPILNRVTRIPVGGDSGSFPALDQYITPAAGSGQTALAAGIRAAQRAPGATTQETEPAFENVEYRIHNVGGHTEVENEMMADSPLAIGALLERLFAIAVASKNVRNILRGSGAGEPLGILNSAAAIGITPDDDGDFAYADALEMKSRFKQVGGEPLWIWHPGIWPDVGIFETTNGGGVFNANLATAGPAQLLGYGYQDNEHMPQDDNAGCVLLADLTAYLFFERQGLVVATSEHAAFKENKTVWRFTQRNDGQPWVRNAITLADPQGSYTVSPFVYLND